MLDARRLRRAIELERLTYRRRHGLFRVHVLARRDRLRDELGPQARGRGIEIHRIVLVREGSGEIRRPALDAVRLGERFELRTVAAHQNRIGHYSTAVGQRDPSLRANRANGANQMLIRPHATSDAVHDDPESDRIHADSPRIGLRAMAPMPRMRLMLGPLPRAASSSSNRVAPMTQSRAPAKTRDRSHPPVSRGRPRPGARDTDADAQPESARLPW